MSPKILTPIPKYPSTSSLPHGTDAEIAPRASEECSTKPDTGSPPNDVSSTSNKSFGDRIASDPRKEGAGGLRNSFTSILRGTHPSLSCGGIANTSADDEPAAAAAIVVVLVFIP